MSNANEWSEGPIIHVKKRQEPELPNLDGVDNSAPMTKGGQVMLIPRQVVNVSPQCSEGQERGYRLGYYQGQTDMADEHDGTPCRVIQMQNEIERLRGALVRIQDLTQHNTGMSERDETCVWHETTKALKEGE